MDLPRLNRNEIAKPIIAALWSSLLFSVCSNECETLDD